MITIKNLEIKGIRGIKEELSIDLSLSKSILIFGDNGSGKSSITDAIEWYYGDKVEYLSMEEIGRKGLEALRNISLSDDDESYVYLKLSNSKLDVKKKLTIQHSRLVSEFIAPSEEHENYIKISQNESTILRYRQLTEFMLKTKSEKLREISSIIGFEEISRVQGVFKKAINDLKKFGKIRNFDNQINTKQSQILTQLQQPTHTDKQYFEAIQNLIIPLELDIEIKSHKEIKSVLERIAHFKNEERISQELSYEKLIGDLETLSKSSDSILCSYKHCIDKYKTICEDVDKFKKIKLDNFLREGLVILEKGYFDEGSCPLCLRDKNREELINELRRRVEELDIFKKEKEKVAEEIKTASDVLQEHVSILEGDLKEKCIEKDSAVKDEIGKILGVLNKSYAVLEKMSHFDGYLIQEIDASVNLDRAKLEKLSHSLRESRDKMSKDKKGDLRTSIHTKISLVESLYKEISSLKKESELLRHQIESIQILYDEFVKKQKAELHSFLRAISKDINSMYLYMNTLEGVDEIELIPLGEEDELVGVTIQFKFHGKIESPPNKYLSESHINCIGICLFLASVKAFNGTNGFFILDDVISSFDKTHRMRFARLLIEKFSDYQVILLTHEKDWFELVSNMVKGKNWIIESIKWNSEKGAYIDEAPVALKEKIKVQISSGSVDGLGNKIRKYLEHLLKEIAHSLEAKVKFLFNDSNENRMSYELLTVLKSHLNKHATAELKDTPIINRLLTSTFLGNKTSHDGSFVESIGDLTAFWKDVTELEGIFCCNKCGNLISLRHYDDVNKKIRCNCGNVAYAWKV